MFTHNRDVATMLASGEHGDELQALAYSAATMPGDAATRSAAFWRLADRCGEIMVGLSIQGDVREVAHALIEDAEAFARAEMVRAARDATPEYATHEIMPDGSVYPFSRPIRVF